MAGEGGGETLRLQALCNALLASVSAGSAAPGPGSPTPPDVESLQAALVEMVHAMRPQERKAAVGPLLRLLQGAETTDGVADAAAAAMALCCGASASGPSLYRIFTFSPSIHVHVQEMEYAQGGLGWKVWGSSLVMASHLMGMQEVLRGKSVLELGSGCGLCGLLLAKLGASRVVLSDYNPHILQNLCRSVALLPAELADSYNVLRASNPWDGDSETGGGGRGGYDFVYQGNGASRNDQETPRTCDVQVRLLDWFEDAQKDLIPPKTLQGGKEFPPKLPPSERFDIIIGSDLLYEQRSLQPLVSLSTARLSSPHGQALFVAPVRELGLLDDFLADLANVGLVTEVAHVGSQEWDECCKMSGQEIVDAGETWHGPDYYAGGVVAVSVRWP